MGSITVSVLYLSNAGGLVGEQDGSTIISCYSTGSITTSSSLSFDACAAGLVGTQSFYSTIISCYSMGAVNSSTSADAYAGGLLGSTQDETGSIESCYSTGSISATGTDTYQGGLVGFRHDGCSVNRSFWDTQTSGTTDGVGNIDPDPSGAMGKITAEMKTLSTFTPAGWDFFNTDGDPADWMMLRENEDYPRLAWQEIFAGDIAELYGVDIADLMEVINNWLEEGCLTGCEDADIDNSGKVDLADYAILAQYWLEGAKLPAGRPDVAWSGNYREIGNDQPYLEELNITQAETTVLWRFVETSEGNYDFEETRQVVNVLKQNGVKEIILNITPENPLYIDIGSSQKTIPQNPQQWTAYKNFLTATVNNFKNEAQFYQVVRELNPARFLGTAQDYAELLKFSSDTIKAIDPNAKIVFGAMPYELRREPDRQNFIADVIHYLPENKKYFDAIDVHLHRLQQDDGGPLTVDNGAYYTAKVIDFYKNQYAGTMYEDSLLFFETSSYTAQPGEMIDLPSQTEDQQSQDLQNRLTVLAGKDVYWINLEGGILQRKYFMFSAGGQIINASLQYFEHTGLIWNPTVNEGKTGKKKAFDAVKNWNKK
jgi:hypothetical protein